MAGSSRANRSQARTVFRVRRFWEKPRSDVAGELLRAGCMWNTFVMVARVSTLIGLIWSHCPNCSFRSRRFTSCWAPRGSQGHRKAVRAHPSASFSNEVLERYPINLQACFRFTASNGAISASLCGSWLFCPAWEFIPNGTLRSRLGFRERPR